MVSESAPKAGPSGSLLSKKDYELGRFDSNRFTDWKSAITVIKKNNFKGHGAQSDRIFISNLSIMLFCIQHCLVVQFQL